MSLVKKIWTDQVGSKVIATAIVALLVAGATIFFDFWPTIKGFGTEAYNLALTPTPLPNWLIAILGLLAAIPILLLLAIIWEQAFSSAPNAEEWRNYSSDDFFGLRWRWHYFNNAQPHTLCTFCPACDFQLYGKSRDSFTHGISSMEFNCDSCGKRFDVFEDSHGEMEDKVKRFIQQKLRNGTWPRKLVK